MMSLSFSVPANILFFIFLGGHLDLSKSVRCLKLVELSDIVTSNQAEGNPKYYITNAQW